MKRMRKYLPFALLAAAVLAVLILALHPFSRKTASQEIDALPQTQNGVAAPTRLTLGWAAADGFNPYLVNNTLVLQNAGLLFERLVEITPSMDLDYRLAQSIDTTDTQVIITLRGGCFFADGTPITADDVAACFSAAIGSLVYGGRFSHVSVIEVVENSLVLTLDSPDSLFAYLCDIPILKASEVGLQTPTASGRYTYGEENTLTKNSRAPFPEDGPVTIDLVKVSSYEEMVSALAVDSLSLYAASGEGDSSGINSQESYYKTNQLIFLGVNAGSDKAILNTAAGRRALSALLNRRQLAEKSYYSRAYPATGAINSFYPCVNSQQVILAEQDDSDIAEPMAELGYTKDESSALWSATPETADETGSPLTVSLLVYGGNTYKRYAASLIAQQLATQGITVQINMVEDFDSYAQSVQSGEFELYIGEVKLYNDMDLSPFLSGGALSAGLAQNEELALAYTAFKANKSAAGQFEQIFAREMPFVPLLWCNGTVISNHGVAGLSSSCSNIFYSVASLSVTSGF